MYIAVCNNIDDGFIFILECLEYKGIRSIFIK